MEPAIHRIIEQQAARGPERVAIVDGARQVTYRELNLRANTLARRLAESGLTRGSLALVRMPRSLDLATVLLAVLKGGACYALSEPGSPADLNLPTPFCIVREQSSGDQQYLALNVDRALAESASRPGPNLPVLTRGSDVACVLPDDHGQPQILVPHATIAALLHNAPAGAADREVAWDGAAGALDLWLALMSGATMSVGAPFAVPLPKPAAA